MRNVLHSNHYNGYRLSQTSKGDEGFYTEILGKAERLLDHMISRHCKVFFISLTLLYPAGSLGFYPTDNSLLSRVLDSLTRFYTRKGIDVKYLWVREVSTTGQPHYHLALFLNGNKIQNGYGVLREMDERWSNILGVAKQSGLVDLSRSRRYAGTGEVVDPYGGVKIVRGAPGFQEMYETCFERVSYLAKCYSKGETAAYVNVFGSSVVAGYA